jgi:hypothetical protein
MNGWSILGGEINCDTVGGVCVHFLKSVQSGSGGTVYAERVRTELVTPSSLGYVFDSAVSTPWQGGVVTRPQMVLKSPGIIGCDFQFCDSITLDNVYAGNIVSGAYGWRFGPKATSCVVVENNILPVLNVHFLDQSASGSGNTVIYRGIIVHQS